MVEATSTDSRQFSIRASVNSVTLLNISDPCKLGPKTLSEGTDDGFDTTRCRHDTELIVFSPKHREPRGVFLWQPMMDGQGLGIEDNANTRSCRPPSVLGSGLR